jgi:hypothetical protein
MAVLKNTKWNNARNAGWLFDKNEIGFFEPRNQVVIDMQIRWLREHEHEKTDFLSEAFKAEIQHTAGTQPHYWHTAPLLMMTFHAGPRC